MRIAKRQVALITGLADITGIWPLSRVTGTLSRLAEATLTIGVRHLILAAHSRGILHLPAPETDPDKGSGVTVLALGKLGGRELNYSSDIDLIVFYDPAAVDFGGDSHGAFYTGSRVIWSNSWRQGTLTATSFVSICGSAPTPRRCRWPSRCRQR